VQATVYRFDSDSGSGQVLTDGGVLLPFASDALATSGLRHLRPGQRLTVEVTDERVVRLSLGSIRPPSPR